MPPRPTPVARRTTLGAALVGLVAVGGCDLEDLDPRSEPAPVTPTTSAPPEDADVDLVEAVVTDLSAALGAASALRGADRATGRAFTRLHRRHLTELDATDEVSTMTGGGLSTWRNWRFVLSRLKDSAAGECPSRKGTICSAPPSL